MQSLDVRWKPIRLTALYDLLIFFFCKQSSVQRNLCSCNKPDRNTLAMQEFKIHEFFYCMANRMTKIKQCTFSLLFWITFYNTCFDLTAATNHFLQKCYIQLLYFFLLRTHKLIKVSVADKPCLQDFSHATGKLFCRKRTQCVKVHINKTRLMESTYHVFILLQIYSGLTSNTAVHLRKKCCRNLNKIDTAKICCRTKSCKITYHTASKRNDQTLTVQFFLDQYFIKLLYCIQIFAFFTCFKCKHRYFGSYW